MLPVMELPLMASEDAVSASQLSPRTSVVSLRLAAFWPTQSHLRPPPALSVAFVSSSQSLLSHWTWALGLESLAG